MLRIISLFLVARSAAAAEASAPAVSAGTYLQAGLALALIVTILFGMAWLAKKMSGGKGFGQGGMKIVGGVVLGQRERIVLLEIGDEWLVIGIVPGQIRTLHRLAKGSPLPADLPPGAEQPFAQWLKGATRRGHHE